MSSAKLVTAMSPRPCEDLLRTKILSSKIQWHDGEIDVEDNNRLIPSRFRSIIVAAPTKIILIVSCYLCRSSPFSSSTEPFTRIHHGSTSIVSFARCGSSFADACKVQVSGWVCVCSTREEIFSEGWEFSSGAMLTRFAYFRLAFY